ncbi:MAG: hypothetical protein ABIK68_19560 [bacterium]
MQSRLKRTYFGFLTPVLAGFICGFLNKEFKLALFRQGETAEFFVVATFIGSLVFAIAAPIFIRTIFAHRQRHQTHIPEDRFIRFELNLIRVALLTPYFSLVAYLWDFPEFYMAGSFLAALYAIYYFYPSQRRIIFEKRIFRVR